MTFEEWYKAMVDSGWQPMGVQLGMFNDDDVDMPNWMHENGKLMTANEAEGFWLSGVIPTPF